MTARLTLTRRENAELHRLVGLALADPVLCDPRAFADQATGFAARAPSRLREFIVGVRERQDEIAVVAGLEPGEDLPPTPAGWSHGAASGAGLRAELLLLLCGAIAAEPFGWASQQEGRIVHDVCPDPAQAVSLTSGSSSLELALHTEDAFHDCRADYVALYCLRNPDAVGTTFVRVHDLAIEPELERILAEPVFRFHRDDSHAGAPASATGPVLFGPSGRRYLRFDEDFTEPLSDDARHTLKTLGERCRSHLRRLVLAPGDVAFLDNYQVAHGRAPFTARYDGHDRWLKRLNLIRDIRRVYTTTSRPSRIIG